VASDRGRIRLMWPDLEAGPVVRAREVASAYRQAAITAQAQVEEARKVLASLDQRLLAFAGVDVDKLAVGEASDRVAELDAQFSEWGERWHAASPEFVFDDDDEVPTWVAAEILGVRGNTVGDYRGAGMIKGRFIKFSSVGVYVFRVGDVRALAVELAAKIAQGRPGFGRPPKRGGAQEKLRRQQNPRNVDTSEH
jgi:hypothetical protein